MKRIAFLVEGKTETEFVNDILQNELGGTDIVVLNLTGGVFSLPCMLKSIKPLLKDKFDCITTMVDLHRFKNPGRKNSAKDIQRELEKAVNEIKHHSDTVFLPYVQKHEFEALLFADRQAIEKHLSLNAAQCKKLRNIDGDPEDINHDMPPSKRLRVIYPQYDKLLNGIKIARNIGLQKITQECPHFSEWLKQLKKIVKQ